MTPDRPSPREHWPAGSRPTRATLTIAGSRVTILPRRAPVGNSGPIRGRTLAIYPGEPSHNQITATIDPGGVAGFAIFDLDERAAAKLGRALGLAEILFWDGRRAALLACSTTTSL